MGLLATVEAAVQQLEAATLALEPDLLSGADAARLVAAFAKAEKLAAAGKALCAKRAADCEVWRSAGERSAAHWLARNTGTPLNQAATTLETAGRMAQLPDVEAAYKEGELSGTQANEIAQAAIKNPDAQDELLAAARSDTVQGLQKKCRDVIAAAQDEDIRHKRLHARRFHKTWTDPDGMFRVSMGLTPEVGAAWLAVLAPFEAEAFETARKEGRQEPYAAYGADAVAGIIAALSGGEARAKGKVPAQVTVLIDHAALLRGHAADGETAEIAGVGPVPVSVVRDMMESGDPFLAAVITDGKDVFNVAHLGRKPTRHQRTALSVRDRLTCTVETCHESRHLEIDHVEPWAKTRRTLLRELALLCRFHHRQKSEEGYQLRRRADGGWDWIKPERPPPP